MRLYPTWTLSLRHSNLRCLQLEWSVIVKMVIEQLGVGDQVCVGDRNVQHALPCSPIQHFWRALWVWIAKANLFPVRVTTQNTQNLGTGLSQSVVWAACRRFRPSDSYSYPYDIFAWIRGPYKQLYIITKHSFRVFNEFMPNGYFLQELIGRSN